MYRTSSKLSGHKSRQKWKIPYFKILAIMASQFILSSMILCYGIVIMQLIHEEFYDLKTALWAPILFITIAKITNPWTTSYCKIKYFPRKGNIIIAVAVLSVVLMLIALIKGILIHLLLLGIVGGFLSTFIYVHLKFAAKEIFESRPKLFHILHQLNEALVLILMPHLFLFLINIYNVFGTFWILSATVLNIIPACLIIVRRAEFKKCPLRKFQTIENISIEMLDFANENEEGNSSDIEEAEEEEEIDSIVSEIDSANLYMYYRSTGVNILPNIPEEDENETDDDINEISSKRLSKISAILSNLSENSTKDCNSSINNLFHQVDVELPEVVINEGKMHNSFCFCIDSDLIYEIQLKKEQVQNFIIKNVREPYFYPAFISSTITTSLSTIVLASAPYITFRNSPFLLTIIGFSWLFFLAGYPVFSKLSPIKVKILLLIGLSISGLSLYVLEKFSCDNFTIFAFTFGLGHGIVTFSENLAIEVISGQESWTKWQGFLQISTGLSVILIYLIIYFSNLEIKILLANAHWAYVFDLVLWIVVYISNFILIYVKKIDYYKQDLPK